MRAAAVLIGLGVFAGLIVMAVAGVTAATAVLVTAAAMLAMIALGSLLGARRTPGASPDAEDRKRTLEG
jgi:drug/metabolite transporter (DMT)-like permease